MIHIVFNEQEISLMNQVIEQDETLTGEVVQIKDDYAVGPLAGLDTEEGWQARYNWWMGLLENSPYAGTNTVKFDDRETVKELKEKLAPIPEEQIMDLDGTKSARCNRVLLADATVERLCGTHHDLVFEQSSFYQ